MRVARASDGGTVGALSGAILAGALITLGLVEATSWVPGTLLLSMVVVLFLAVFPGWIVGSRVGPTPRSSILGIVAYAVVIWLLWVPISVVGSTWQGVRDGTFANPVEVVLAMVFQLAYAALLSVFLWMVAVLPGIVWMVTFRLLGRLLSR